MKNVSASAQMGSWKSTAAHSEVARAQDPLARYQAAKALVGRLRNEIQAMIDKALRTGFDLMEAIMLPAIRQALTAARLALAELAAARTLLPN